MRVFLRRVSAMLRSSTTVSPPLESSIYKHNTHNHHQRNLTSCCTTPLKINFYPSSHWSTTQIRHAKCSGSDVRVGQVIQRKGKIYQVIKAHHTTQGRQGAIIQVELRDVDSGSKSNERLRTDEAIEKVFVQTKQLTYLYTDDETGNIVLMDPETFDQVEVPRHLFNDSVAYLQDDIKVTVELFDERPMSASLPTRVTCTVAEAGEANKQSSKSSPTKKVVLDNGVTIQVPSHISAGDKIAINTVENTYMGKA